MKDQDKPKTLPEEQTIVGEQTLSQGVDTQSDTEEPFQTIEDTEDSQKVFVHYGLH